MGGKLSAFSGIGLIGFLLLIPLGAFSMTLPLDHALAQEVETITGLEIYHDNGQQVREATHEKFGTNFEYFVDESGWLYKVYDMWNPDTITGLWGNDIRTFQTTNDDWHFELENDELFVVLNEITSQPEYPNVTENYTITQDGEDTFTFETHQSFINQDDTWLPYILTEETDIVQVETSGGTFVFDKNNCAVTILNGNEIIVKSDSYVVRSAEIGTDVWFPLSVNDEACITDIIEDNLTISIAFTKQNNEGVYKLEYKITQGHVKTTASFHNQSYENNKFAFTQSVQLPDTITLMGQEFDLTQMVGMSFDRETLEENIDMVFEAQNLLFNAGLGFEQLWSVSISENAQVNLDYANQE